MNEFDTERHEVRNLAHGHGIHGRGDHVDPERIDRIWDRIEDATQPQPHTTQPSRTRRFVLAAAAAAVVIALGGITITTNLWNPETGNITPPGPTPTATETDHYRGPEPTLDELADRATTIAIINPTPDGPAKAETLKGNPGDAAAAAERVPNDNKRRVLFLNGTTHRTTYAETDPARQTFTREQGHGPESFGLSHLRQLIGV